MSRENSNSLRIDNCKNQRKGFLFGCCRTPSDLPSWPHPSDPPSDAQFLILFLTIRLLINDLPTWWKHEVLFHDCAWLSPGSGWGVLNLPDGHGHRRSPVLNKKCTKHSLFLKHRHFPWSTRSLYTFCDFITNTESSSNLSRPCPCLQDIASDVVLDSAWQAPGWVVRIGRQGHWGWWVPDCQGEETVQSYTSKVSTHIHRRRNLTSKSL